MIAYRTTYQGVHTGTTASAAASAAGKGTFAATLRARGAAAAGLAGHGTATASFSGNLSAVAIAPLEVRLTWNDAGAPGDTHYPIERADGAGGWYRVGTAYSDLKRFTDWGRQPNIAYSYRMRSVDSTRGTSAYSNTAVATTMSEDGAGEWHGPLANWKNLVSDYGADPTGAADSTSAINAALAALSTHASGAYCVYAPPGTYKVTALLHSTHAKGVTLMGDDPATTIFKWFGSAGGDMMHWDANLSRIGRLTFDGSGTANVGLAYGPTFSTFNETVDCVFQDCAIGLQGGVAGGLGQAENHIHRCRFLRCSTYGAIPADPNSLDLWFWHCTFDTCAIAIRNNNGNFHAWHCLFKNSTTVDLATFGFMVMSQVNNVSINSHQFLDWSVAGGSECGITVSGNRVVTPAISPAINLGQYGPNLILDNLVRAAPGVSAAQVRTMAQFNGFVTQNCLMAGNLFNIASASTDSDPTLRRLDEEQPTTQPIDPTAPFMPGTAPKVARTVFEVTAGASAATIQAAINNAAAAAARSIVHLPHGDYSLATTLSVPANATLQIIGDSIDDSGGGVGGTILTWTGAAGQALIYFNGPTKALMTECVVKPGAGIGILADTLDQDGGHVYCEQLSCQGDGSTTVGFLVNGLDHADVTCVGHQGSDCAVWTKVVGGTLRNAGSAAPNRVCILTGATATSTQQYDVQNGGELTVRSVFHETDSAGGTALNLGGRGKLWVDSTRFSYRTASGQPTVLLNGFQGDFVLANAFMLPVNAGSPPQPTCKVSATASGAAMRALVLCCDFNSDHAVAAISEMYTDATSPAGTNAFLNSVPGNPGTSLGNGGTMSDNNLRSLLGNLRRATVRLPGSTPAGVTDLRLSRLFVQSLTANGQDVVLNP